MRISDWSSDVCSSDLPGIAIDADGAATKRPLLVIGWARGIDGIAHGAFLSTHHHFFGVAVAFQIDQLECHIVEAGQVLSRFALISEERRGGKECVRTCSYWGSRFP